MDTAAGSPVAREITASAGFLRQKACWYGTNDDILQNDIWKNVYGIYVGTAYYTLYGI